jgi:branched-chain amino acid transport system permease protein
MDIDLSLIFLQLYSGICRAMMLFLLSSGLSLIFGVMNILNFAHATLWLFSGYLTYTFFTFFSKIINLQAIAIIPSIIAATSVMFIIGYLLEKFIIRKMYSRELPEQLLLTFSLILIFGDIIRLIWGVENRRIFLPIEPLEIMGSFVNPYYFVIIISGLGTALGLFLFLSKSRLGKIIRAAVYSRNMVSALGIKIPVIYGVVFGLGIAIASFSAGVFLPIMPIGLGLDMDLIIQCFAVVVIGGFGSILGTFVASLIIGIVYSFTILIWPHLALVGIFVILVVVLIWKPWGLFGTEMRY